MDSSLKTIINAVFISLNKKVISTEQVIGHGSVNQIFIVTTETEKLVIRLNHNRGFDEFVKEKWCIEQATNKGVPNPKVFKLGEFDGYSYIVQSFLEGVVGSHAQVDTVAVWREIGKYAKLIHSIPVSGFGLDSSELMESTTNTSVDKWKKYVAYNIESLTQDDKLLELGALNNEQSKKVKNIFEELYEKQFSFGLNHGDLSLKNVMILPTNKVSIFDWGSAEAQIVPHHDFGEILKSSLKNGSPKFQSFLQGYGLADEGYKKIEEDIHSLMLLRAIDKLRWAIDKHPIDIPSGVERVKELYQLRFS